MEAKFKVKYELPIFQLNERFAQFIQYLVIRDYMKQFNEDFDVWEMFASVNGYISLNFFKKGAIVPHEADFKVSFKRLFSSVVYCK